MIGQGGGATWPPIRTVDKFYTRGVDGAMFQANDATYDGLRDKYMSSNTEDEAARVIQELDRYVIEQHWGVWVQAASTHYFTQPYVKGFDSRKASGMSLFKYLWVDQKLKDSMKQ